MDDLGKRHVLLISISSRYGAEGNATFAERKATMDGFNAKAQRAVANDSLRPSVFALIFVLYLKLGPNAARLSLRNES